jgi:aryl-alcohol dehydrogenase-like predicted oxidoreductase
MVETALSLGISYFDVAPMYGDGTAEEVLGHVIGNSKDVAITTKVGPPRPCFNVRRQFFRGLVKPALDRARGIKMILRDALPKSAAEVVSCNRFDFSAPAILRSLETSLHLLKRSQVDLILAHDPTPTDLNSQVAGGFKAMVDGGLALGFGAGVDVRSDAWAPFGQIWQSGWPGSSVKEYAGDFFYIYHGVLRYAEKDWRGQYIKTAGSMIADARMASPKSVILISASTPARLRELVFAAQDAGA